jgi:hypothetical protein
MTPPLSAEDISDQAARIKMDVSDQTSDDGGQIAPA